MAARRLIIIMVILLGISTLLAALLPDRVRDAEEEKTASESIESTASTETPEVAADPCKTALKCFEIDADLPKIAVIPVEEGDQLVLEVDYSQDDLVEIGELGFIDVVGPDSPATFDVFVDQPGEYGVRLTDANRIIGRIEVSQPAPEASKPPSGGGSP